MQLQKIVYVAGVSLDDEAQLRQAATLAQALGAELTALLVLGRRASDGAEKVGLWRLRQQAEQLGLHELPLLVQRGNTQRDAVNVALEEGGFDALVLASPARRQFFPAVAGSGVAPLLRGVRVPIIMLPQRQPNVPTSIEQVLLPVDLLPRSLPVFDAVAGFCAHYGAKLTMLRVFDIAQPAPATEERVAARSPVQLLRVDQAQVEELRARVAQQVANVELLSREGTAYREIVGALNEVQPSLLVLVNHGPRRTADVLGGSTTDRVLEQARVPVLVLRP